MERYQRYELIERAEMFGKKALAVKSFADACRKDDPNLAAVLDKDSEAFWKSSANIRLILRESIKEKA